MDAIEVRLKDERADLKKRMINSEELEVGQDLLKSKKTVFDKMKTICNQVGNLTVSPLICAVIQMHENFIRDEEPTSLILEGQTILKAGRLDGITVFRDVMATTEFWLFEKYSCSSTE